MLVRAGILLLATGDIGSDEERMGDVAALLRQSLPGLLLARQESMGSERYLIEEILRRWCDEEELDLLLTIGGTFPAPGPSPSMMPSLLETMRAIALEEDTRAILDRGVAGIRGRTLIVNLPEGPTLTLLFLQSIADLLEPVLAQLQPEPRLSLPAPAPDMPPKSTLDKRSLDPGEFEAFLQQRKEKKNE
jgi:molybdopterin adenylyltransferase